MPQVKDPYAALGVDRKASDAEIKKAYRKLAREYHPDKNPGDERAEERFKEVQEAYDVLSDPEKKKRFDSGGGIFGGGGFGGGGFDPGAFRGGFGDILSDLFGGGGAGPGPGGRGAPRPERGRDLETDVHVSFEQAMEGAQIPISVPLSAPCPTCHGSGAKPGTTPEVCSRCQGRGVEAESQGLFSISQPCRQCGGTGTEIKDPCPTCGGSGQTRQVKRYRVNVPAGVREGSRVRLAGKGEQGPRGGAAGDLYVVTHVAPSPVFRRKGDNLEVDVPITIVEAIRGATIEVPILGGATKRIRVAPGTAHGTVQRLRGEGPPKLGGKGRGDIHYRLQIDVPRSLSSEQREAVEGLAEVMDGNPREQLLSGTRTRAGAGTGPSTGGEATGGDS
ncbi:MAG: molecular chaperone DnaJ [Thermoleophilaceae bacterium]